MNKNQTTVALLAVGASSAALATWKKYTKNIAGRFPEIDKKIVRKAYRKMLVNSLRGKYTDDQLATDESKDILFLAEVQKLTAS